MYTFVTSQGRVTIRCHLDYARWLVDTGRVHGGVYRDLCIVIYL